MHYTKYTPCADCPFLPGTEHAYTEDRLEQFASSEFPCHKTARLDDDGFTATKSSVHCAGALLYLEKRERPHQLMRIAGRLGMYDHAKLDTSVAVR